MLNKCTAPFEVKSFGKDGSFSGYASVFNELDDHGDRVLKGAFQHSIQKMNQQRERPKMLWQHNLEEPIGTWEEPIGTWEEVIEDDYGLHVRGQLILEVKRGREAYALMKAGVLDSLSIGYRVVQSQKGKSAKERHLTQLELFEISLVTFPANRAAKIVQLKNRESIDDHLIQIINRTIHVLKS